MRSSYALLLFPLACSAFQLPFKVPFLSSTAVIGEPEAPSGTPRIAIIGAGAGGSSAAFWIAKAKERFGLNVEVDVYEKESHVGGRSTIVYPYNDTTLPAVELGGSIFVEANKNLWRASQEFNLTLRDFNDEGSTMGVWDGSSILFSAGDGWWDNAKLLWRFGTAPLRAKWITDDIVKKFLRLYAYDHPKWDDIRDLAAQLDVAQLVEDTGEDYYRGKGVSEKFVFEVMEAATRVNYGQNIDALHAFGAAVSIATNGATGIQGGNYQLFEQFLNRSGATTYLNTPVTSISDSESFWTVRTAGSAKAYKAVILAAPLQSSGVSINAPNVVEVPEVSYYHLHVTLLSTTSPRPNPEYFKAKTEDIPSTILTTYEGARRNETVPEFNSLSYHGAIRDGEWVVKIFSQHEISDEWLNEMFMGKVGWVHRKEWDAYPKLRPNSPMPPVKLDTNFYYVNAFEPFISTMETETVAARNVVDLLLNEAFGTSICGHRLPDPHTRRAQDSKYTYGWDC
ncbi:Prenylcysteine lyase-domain-containing protein [Schizophyllum fasciatum]